MSRTLSEFQPGVPAGLDCLAEEFLKIGPSRHDYPNPDRSFAVKSLEVDKVSVEKRVFIIPLHFNRDPGVRRVARALSKHVNFVTADFLNSLTVNKLFDDDISFTPTESGQTFIEPLSVGCSGASTSLNFRYVDREFLQILN